MSASIRPISIGIELIDDPGWMGGTLYLKNLAICLSRLPDAERPRIRLLGVAARHRLAPRRASGPACRRRDRRCGARHGDQFLRK